MAFIISASAKGDRNLGDDVIRFALTSSELMTVDTANRPWLVFTLGRGERPVAYDAGSGSETRSFAFTVTPGDRDEGGIRIDRLEMPAASSIRAGRGAVSTAIQWGNGPADSNVANRPG